MDVKELSNKKKALDLQIAANIRGFEMETEMQVTGVKSIGMKRESKA